MLLLAIAVGAGFALLPRTAAVDSADAKRKDESTSNSALKASDDSFPRRALAVCVTNYLYANPIAYGDTGHGLHSLMDRMSRFLHIPTSQVAELCDGAPNPANQPTPLSPKKNGPETQKPAQSTPVPPLKNVIEKTVTEFLDGSRAQDRIILLWIGHVLEIDGAGYLVPLEGEPTVKETLLPLTWLYGRLAACKARQKVLILDTCRLDPTRGQERPGSGPMGAKLDALLAKPPAGVQVWSACTTDQFSYETDDGSIFLTKLYDALTQTSLKKKIQEQTDPIPLDALAEVVGKSCTEAAREQWQAKQTPRLVGSEAERGASFDREEPLPPKLEVALPAFPGGTARQAEIASIFGEVVLPPIRKTSLQAAPLNIETLIPFAEKTLELYRADYSSLKSIEDNAAKYPLRAVTLEAVKLMRRAFAPGNKNFSIQEVYAGGNRDKIKAEIGNSQQRNLAMVEGDLTDALNNLERAGEDRKEETSKRWQANYDYVHAQLLARLAFIHEYNLMLAKIRSDSLPQPEGFTPSGWRLSSQDKQQGGKEMRDKVQKANKILDKLVKNHPGTPWEILAKRDRTQALGLKWEPYR
jgi:hypothetical protein